MATIVFSLSTKQNNTDGKQEVMMRLYQGRINQRGKTGLFAIAKYWDAQKQRFAVPKTRKRILSPEEEAVADMVNGLNAELADIERYVLERFREAGSGRNGLADKWLANCLSDRLSGITQSEVPSNDFFAVFEKYLSQKDISDSRVNHFMVNIRELKRFASYRGIEMSFDSLDSDFLYDFEDFLLREHTFYYIDDNKQIVFLDPLYAEAFRTAPESRPPKSRSKNTIQGKMTRLHTFLIWAKARGYINKDPFEDYEIGTAIYGDPIYLTANERDALYRADLSKDPGLAVQRDVFILQCFIGCRVGDYYRMTKQNYFDGAIHYIPSKTQKGKSLTVYLVNDIAQEILQRYPDVAGDRLMPFISEQEYNRKIKEMIREAGIDRIVTVLDPMTRQEKQCMLSETASSHMARRTFIGILYKQVRDPNLISKVSGHSENSRAFVRYRKIDEDDAKELLSKL